MSEDGDSQAVGMYTDVYNIDFMLTFGCSIYSAFQPSYFRKECGTISWCELT